MSDLQQRCLHVLIYRVLLLSIIFNTTSFAKEVTEVWECKDRYDTSEDFFGISISEVLITAKITSSDSGEIDVAGITHKTLYGVQGFDRRWDFGDESSRYGFVILPFLTLAKNRISVV